MENIIEELIRIESEADEIVDEALAIRQELARRIDEAAAKLTADIDAETENEIKILTERADAEISEQVEEIKKLSKQWFSRFKTEYETNRERWRDEIVSRIIGNGARISDGL